MIVVIKRKFGFQRIENAENITIENLKDAIEYLEKRIEVKEKIANEFNSKSIFYKDIALRTIQKDVELITIDKAQMEMGYNYIILVETSNLSYPVYVKNIGKEQEIEKLYSDKKVRFIEIDEEYGITKVETE